MWILYKPQRERIWKDVTKHLHIWDCSKCCRSLLCVCPFVFPHLRSPPPSPFALWNSIPIVPALILTFLSSYQPDMTKAHQAIYSRLFAHFLWWAHFEAAVPIKLWLSLLQRPCSNCDFKIEGIKGIVGRVGKLASCRNPCCHVSRCVPFNYQRLFLWDLERLWLFSEENKKQKNKKQTNTQFNTDKTLFWTTCTFSMLRNNKTQLLGGVISKVPL